MGLWDMTPAFCNTVVAYNGLSVLFYNKLPSGRKSRKVPSKIPILEVLALEPLEQNIFAKE